MAELELSALASDASGRLGNYVIYHRGGRALIRAYTKPSKPFTPSQLAIQTIWKNLRALWGTISEANRQSWAFAAAQIFWYNRVGNKFHPSAQQFFLYCNGNLVNCGLSPLNAFVSPVIYKEIINPVFWYSDPVAVCFGVSFTGQTTPANVRYMIYATRGLNAGIMNGDKYLRYIGNIPPGTADNYDFTFQYLSLFSAPVVGQKVFFLLKPVDITSGISGIINKFSTIYTHSGTPVQKPTDIVGCKLWLDSSQGVTVGGGNKVSLWADQSGSDNDFSQSDSSKQPVLTNNLINGKPAIVFDGVASCLQNVSFVLAQPYTVFIVWKASSGVTLYGSVSGTYPCFIYFFSGFFWGSDTANYLFIGALSDNNLSSIIFDGPGSNIYRNSGLLSSVDVGSSPLGHNDGVQLGLMCGIYPLAGYIAEMIVYNSHLSDSNRGLVETYLNTKYAIF